MPTGSHFSATVDILSVENLNAASYHVAFDPGVLELMEVAPGSINGTAVPVDFNEDPPGIVSIVQSLPGLESASGSGYLAWLTFHVVDTEGGDSEIGFGYQAEGRVLSNTLAKKIPAEWTGTAIRVVCP